MADINTIDFSRIRRVVLVDTRQPGRIGKFVELIGLPDVEIHVYDHHPLMENDIRGDMELCRVTGATITILSHLLREQGLDITPDEATIMTLGIYEDTGSFSFSSTTEEDFEAAAFFLSKGANLNTVSDLISREISPRQVSLLNDMIQAATHYNINGVELVLTTVITDDYVPDFAFLVHKMVKMENLDAIFTVAAMGSKIYIVARSRIPEVDVGAVLSTFGGGGHPFAAAATVKGMTLTQVEQTLLDRLYKDIRSRRLARDLMSSPPIGIPPEISCLEAHDALTRYNVNALLVMDSVDHKRKLAGYITRQIIEKTLFHKLEHVPVKEYMTTEVESVGPEADLPEIQETIIENKQRILPVVDKGSVIGVITRTDLLNLLVRQTRGKKGALPDPIQKIRHARTRNINKFMRERLTKRMLDLLKTMGQVADDLDHSAFVVGGFVRDLFLYRSNEDTDIVIEGDGIAFARAYAKLVGARVHTHKKFGTAVIIFPDGFKVDVASARMEYYKFPAAMPVVEMSSIKLDMFRRDFTVNTLAIQLNPKSFGTLIDFFSAQRDLKERVIRVLHNLSFVEDPTRVFRAIRFEQRFGFTIGKLTSNLIENAVKMDFFRRLSGRRVFSELRLILEEENPTPAILRMRDYDLLQVIHPSIELDSDRIQMIDSVKQVVAWRDLLFLEESYMKWAVYFLALIRGCSRKIAEAICDRFELAPRYRRIFTKERILADRCLANLERHHPAKNSTLYHRLVGFRTELILYMMAATEDRWVKQAISRYYTRLRHMEPAITGKDLKSLGYEPGPVYRDILQGILYRKLNGRLKTRSDELEFARRYASNS